MLFLCTLKSLRPANVFNAVSVCTFAAQKSVVGLHVALVACAFEWTGTPRLHGLLSPALATFSVLVVAGGWFLRNRTLHPGGTKKDTGAANSVRIDRQQL